MSLYIIQEFDPDVMNWVDVEQHNSKDLAEVSIQIIRCTQMYSHLRIIERVTPYWADGPNTIPPPGHSLKMMKQLVYRKKS